LRTYIGSGPIGGGNPGAHAGKFGPRLWEEKVMKVATATKRNKEQDQLQVRNHNPSNAKFNKGALRRLAYEHPALLLYIIGNDSPSSEESRTVTILLASLVELQSRGYIEMNPAAPTRQDLDNGGIWITKKVPQVLGAGLAVDLFECVSNAHAQVQEVIGKFVEKHSSNPWTLVSSIGQREAKAYGYIFRQEWPKTGLGGLLARMGMGPDTKTIWVRNQLKVRAARQASLILRERIEEFKRRAPRLYREIRNDIVESLTSRKSSGRQLSFRLPQVKKQPAH
jgi:hypothetical protein